MTLCIVLATLGTPRAHADERDDKMLADRVFVHPFLKMQVTPLRSFGLGVAGI